MKEDSNPNNTLEPDEPKTVESESCEYDFCPDCNLVEGREGMEVLNSLQKAYYTGDKSEITSFLDSINGVYKDYYVDGCNTSNDTLDLLNELYSDLLSGAPKYFMHDVFCKQIAFYVDSGEGEWDNDYQSDKSVTIRYTLPQEINGVKSILTFVNNVDLGFDCFTLGNVQGEGYSENEIESREDFAADILTERTPGFSKKINGVSFNSTRDSVYLRENIGTSGYGYWGDLYVKGVNGWQFHLIPQN